MAPSAWKQPSAEARDWQWWLYLAAAGSATLMIWLKPAWPLLLFQAGLFLVAAMLLVSRPMDASLPAALPFAAVASLGLVHLIAQWTPHSFDTVAAILFWTALASMALLCSYTRGGDRLLDAAARLAGVIILLGLAQFFTSHGDIFWLWPSGEFDVFGPFQSRNNFASFVLLFLPYYLWRALERGDALPAVLAAVSTGAVISSGSRAGAALAAAQILIVLYRWRRNRIWALRLALLTACVVAIAGWEILGHKIFDRDPLAHRREMMRSAATLTLERPLLGHGLGAFPTVYPSHALFDSGRLVNHAHNEWLQWSTEGGLPLSLAILSLTAITIFRLRRTPWAISLAAVALHAIVDYPFLRFGLAVWILTIGVAATPGRAIKS